MLVTRILYNRNKARSERGEIRTKDFENIIIV